MVGALVAALLVGVVVSALVGQLDVSARAVVGTVLDGVGVRTSWRPDEDLLVDALWYVRFPGSPCASSSERRSRWRGR